MKTLIVSVVTAGAVLLLVHFAEPTTPADKVQGMIVAAIVAVNLAMWIGSRGRRRPDARYPERKED
jgi:hypothetical protein